MNKTMDNKMNNKIVELFDNVIIKSLNIIGMVYEINGETVIVRTSIGLQKCHICDIDVLQDFE